MRLSDSHSYSYIYIYIYIYRKNLRTKNQKNESKKGQRREKVSLLYVICYASLRSVITDIWKDPTFFGWKGRSAAFIVVHKVRTLRFIAMTSEGIALRSVLCSGLIYVLVDSIPESSGSLCVSQHIESNAF